MKKIAWITDSTCTLSDEICKKHHIYKVPLTVILNGDSYRDGVDITTQEIFDHLSTSTVSTSQPSIGDYVSLYEELKKTYDMGISFHISSHLSGTHSTSVQAGEMVGFPVTGVDSLAGVHPMSAVFLEGITMYENGASVEETIDFLNRRKNDIQIFLTVGSLEQLHRSGRVKSTQALIGTLLNIKPIFHFVNGEVVTSEKVRSQKKAIAQMVSILKKDFEISGVGHISLFHGEALELAEEVEKEILSFIPSEVIEIHPVSPVVGVLAGKGTIGITWVKNS